MASMSRSASRDWFEVPRRSVYYKSPNATPRADTLLAEPLKGSSRTTSKVGLGSCPESGPRDHLTTLALVIDCPTCEAFGSRLSPPGPAQDGGSALEQVLIARSTLGRMPIPLPRDIRLVCTSRASPRWYAAEAMPRHEQNSMV